MGFFAILAKPAQPDFRLEKLDINYCLLPGVFGRYVTICDVGIRIAVSSLPGPNQHQKLSLDIAVPFLVEPDDMLDLVPILRDNGRIANLVFGWDSQPPRPDGNGSHIYFDGEKDVLLSTIDRNSSTRQFQDLQANFGLWTLVTERQVAVGEVLYLRVRFRVREPGRTWTWQAGPRRRSHAISDIRINELRERPQIANAPDFDNYLRRVDSVNCFVAIPSYLKVGRANPIPRSVRVLEGSGWETYLQRRVGDRRSVLVVNNWRQRNVDQGTPFRGFLEVDRRGPTAVRGALIGALVAILAFVLLSSPSSLKDSLVVNAVQEILALVVAVGIAGILAAYKFLIPFVTQRNFRLISKAVRWFEDYRYRVR